MSLSPLHVCKTSSGGDGDAVHHTLRMTNLPVVEISMGTSGALANARPPDGRIEVFHCVGLARVCECVCECVSVCVCEGKLFAMVRCGSTAIFFWLGATRELEGESACFGLFTPWKRD